MKNLSFALLLAVAAMTWVSGATLVSEESAEKVAGKTAGSWLALVDSGKYSDSWSEAAQLFKERITLQEWESALQSVRTPLGKVASRAEEHSLHKDLTRCSRWRVRRHSI